MSTIACYVSGHGFGHAARVAEVLNRLWAERPDITVAIRSPAPAWFLDFNLSGRFVHAPSRLDVGAVQRDSLTVDPEATLRAYAELSARRETVVAAEAVALAACGARLVFADIPALAFDVATRLGIPGIAMANFSWDWIYADYVRDFPSYAGLVDELRSSYARATLLLRLPLHGDLGAFPRIRDVPLVARRATIDRSEVRRRLGLPRAQRLVLLSYGGIGIALRTPPAAPPGVGFITNHTPSSSPPPAWCHAIPTATMMAAGIRYEDLVAASDAVMTKPGYGIVAECIANGTPLIYTPRGRFAEYGCLIAGIEAHTAHAAITNDDLHAGRWLEALESVLSQPRRDPCVDIGGAAAVTRILLEFLGRA